MSTRPPSMDDKDTPSPPRRSHEQYEADKAAGINPFGKPYDRTSWELHANACVAAGLDPETAPPHYHDKVAEKARVESEARAECARRGLDADAVCADGGVLAWMVVATELAGTHAAQPIGEAG